MFVVASDLKVGTTNIRGREKADVCAYLSQCTADQPQPADADTSCGKLPFSTMRFVTCESGKRDLLVNPPSSRKSSSNNAVKIGTALLSVQHTETSDRVV